MEAKDRLEELYRVAVAAGLVRNRKQFATLIGTAEGTLSNSINGVPKYAGTAATLVTRAEAELLKRGVNISGTGDGSTQVVGSNNNVGVPEKKFEHEGEWFALVAEKDKQIDRLLTIIENMQK
jgi:hypothetical protein